MLNQIMVKRQIHRTNAQSCDICQLQMIVNVTYVILPLTIQINVCLLISLVLF